MDEMVVVEVRWLWWVSECVELARKQASLATFITSNQVNEIVKLSYLIHKLVQSLLFCSMTQSLGVGYAVHSSSDLAGHLVTSTSILTRLLLFTKQE